MNQDQGLKKTLIDTGLVCSSSNLRLGCLDTEGHYSAITRLDESWYSFDQSFKALAQLTSGVGAAHRYELRRLNKI